MTIDGYIAASLARQTQRAPCTKQNESHHHHAGVDSRSKAGTRSVFLINYTEPQKGGMNRGTPATDCTTSHFHMSVILEQHDPPE